RQIPARSGGFVWERQNELTYDGVTTSVDVEFSSGKVHFVWDGVAHFRQTKRDFVCRGPR
ncbi:MAG TPA: hypothetical protein VH120_11365, partial [Gemmataceae bacterium]|nr:hypothetical protein [Gemmataceae bacterium]